MRIVHTSRRYVFLAMTVIAFLWFTLELYVQPTYAATFEVDSTADTVLSACTAAANDCTLRGAITAANAAAGADTITFAAGANGTILLTAALPSVTSNTTLTITGNGTTNTIIDGGNSWTAFRLLLGSTLTINGVTVQNATGTNGAAFNNDRGTLSISNSMITGNTGTVTSGGIYNFSGTLSVTDSILSSNVRAIHSNSAQPVTITGSTFSNNTSGAFVATGSNGTITITNSTFNGNSRSGSDGGALSLASGTVSITNTRFTDNSANFAGAIYATGGTMTILNSTVSGNTAATGIVYAGSSSTMTILNSTISGNTATSTSAGIYANGTINLRNSIVANSNGAIACVALGGSGVVNAQNSLIEDGSCGVVSGTNGNLTGDPALNSDLTLQITSSPINAGDNTLIPGGVTTDLAGNARIQQGTVDMGAYESTFTPPPPTNVTISPATRSIAENTSNTFTVTRTGLTVTALTVNLNVAANLPGTDASDYTLSGGSISGQSGNVTVTIPIGQTSVNVTFAAVNDVAAEPDNRVLVTLNTGSYYNLGATTTSTITIPANDFAVTTNSDTAVEGSLRIAITNANNIAGADTITFASGANGTILLFTDLPQITSDITITGNGIANTIIDAATRRIFVIGSGRTVAISGVLLERGAGPAGSDGGGISNAGTLTLTNSTITNNAATNLGGGIYNTGTLSITNTTISDNSTLVNDGGGIYNTGTLTVTGSTFNNNDGNGGGGAIYNTATGVLTVRNSRFTNNVAGGIGGAIYYMGTGASITNSIFSSNSALYGGGIGLIGQASTLTLTNTTLSANTSTSGSGEGGILVNGTLTLRNSIIANSTGDDCAFTLTGEGVPIGTLIAQNSLIEDGGCGIVNGSNGNLTGDPALNSDLTLSATSIAINGGNNSLVPAGVTTDLAGNARIQQGIVDMGAYESAFVSPLPNVTISPANLGFNESENNNFVIARTGGTTAALVVSLTLTPGTGTTAADYTLSGGSISAQTGTVTVTIPVGSASVNLNFMAVNDPIDEVNETLTITLVDGAAYNLGAAITSIATIVDNDTAGITVNPMSGLTTTEAGGTATFTVVLTSQPAANVVIGLSSSDTTEGTVSPTSVTFTSVNWNVAQTVTVTGVSDAIADGNIAYSIVTAPATSSDPNYSGMNAANVSVTNTDTPILNSLNVQLTLQARPAAPSNTYIVSGEVEVRPVGGGAAVLTTTFTSNDQGRFTVTGIPAGTYNLWVKGSHTLATVQNIVVIVGSNNVTTPVLLEGDANDDNLVTIVDFSILATAFGTVTGDAAYATRADFNQDGVISLVDFSLLASNFSVAGAP